MLHIISARCVARDLHTIAPGPLERTCWRRSRRSEEIGSSVPEADALTARPTRR